MPEPESLEQQRAELLETLRRAHDVEPDLHGNVAEHMNLPMRPNQMGSVGGHGFTEMKGSWFIFATTEAHPDDCRWRAPDWHGSAVLSPRSHSNYHLGFRCCRDLTDERQERPRP